MRILRASLETIFVDCPQKNLPAFVEHFAVDSGNVISGSVFFALQGQRVHGFDYAHTAFEKGASLLVTSHPQWQELSELWETKGFIFCDAQTALYRLARFVLAQLPSSTLHIAITGSNGKTSIKEMVRYLLKAQGCSFFVPPGNLNSDIGLPLAVLSLKGDETIAVWEMGINYRGEMAQLSGLIQPHIVLLSSLGKAHIGMFGSFENIVDEKLSILCSRTHTLIYPAQLEDLVKPRVSQELRTYSVESTSARLLEAGRFSWKFLWDQHEFVLSQIGWASLRNCTLVWVLAKLLRWDLNLSLEAFRQMPVPSGRLEWIEDQGILFLHDAYNASLASFEALAEIFEEELLRNALYSQGFRGRWWLVLGGMKELGHFSDEAHRQVWLRFHQHNFWQACFWVGNEWNNLMDEKGPKDYAYPAKELLEKEIPSFVRPGDLLVLKASRSYALETLILSIREC